MANTFECIASTTLTTTTTNIDFISISQNYTDIIAIASINGTSSAHFYVRVGNGSFDTGNNYSYVTIYGRAPNLNPSGNQYGGQASPSEPYARVTAATYGVPDDANVFGIAVMNFHNYSDTNNAKNIITWSSGLGADNYAGVECCTATWENTSAINQIRFYASTGDLTTGTTVTLYGIKRA